MVQCSAHLGGVETRVQRDEDRAELEHGVGQGGELGGISQADGNPVSFLDSEGSQRVSERIGGKIELVVAQGCLGG
jgi:hypothetical protein